MFGFLSFLSWGSISCFQHWHGNMNFKIKKYQWKPTNCREFNAYKYRLAAILFVSCQTYNFKPRMKKIFMDYEKFIMASHNLPFSFREWNSCLDLSAWDLQIQIWKPIPNQNKTPSILEATSEYDWMINQRNQSCDKTNPIKFWEGILRAPSLDRFFE